MGTGARSYVKAHLVSRKVRRSAQLRQQQTTKLWQFDYVPLADEEFPNKHPTQLEKEEHLRELAAACKEDPSVDACKELPQEQEVKEVEDAVVPLRLVEGESNFPEMDANINAPGAVLEDYPGQSGGGESY